MLKKYIPVLIIAILGILDFALIGFAWQNPTQAPPAGNLTLPWMKSGTNVYLSNTLDNVGIGTTTPSAKLEVAGQIKITGGSPGSGKVLTSDSSGLATWQTISLPSGSAGQTLRHNGTEWVANSLLYNNGTNVGIGTTNPQAKLDVAGDIYKNGVIFPQVWFASNTSQQSTNSTSWVDYPLSFNISLPTSGRVIFIFSASDQYNSRDNYRTFFSLVIDGTQKAQAKTGVDDTNYDRGSASIVWSETLSSGTHSVKIQWKTEGGTTYCPYTTGVTISLLALAL